MILIYEANISGDFIIFQHNRLESLASQSKLNWLTKLLSRQARLKNSHEFWRLKPFTFVKPLKLMSQSTNLSIPENVRPALVQLQDEVAKVENTLLELQQKKHEVLQHQLSVAIHKLATLADSINALANSIESEILKFKETAVEFNHLYHTLQDSPDFKALEGDKSKMPRWRPLNIWEINHSAVSVPTVIRRESQFVLTVKAIELHKEIVPQQSVGQTTKLSQFQDAVENRVLAQARS